MGNAIPKKRKKNSKPRDAGDGTGRTPEGFACGVLLLVIAILTFCSSLSMVVILAAVRLLRSAFHVVVMRSSSLL